MSSLLKRKGIMYDETKKKDKNQEQSLTCVEGGWLFPVACGLRDDWTGLC